MNLLIRCSSLGKIMTEAQSIDPSLLDDNTRPLVKSKKRTDEQDEILRKLRDKSLSVGAKTYLTDLAKQGVYGYQTEITSKYLEKGLMVENEAIELYNEVHFESLSKNTERREDDYITGECDLIIPGRKGIDVKCSWSLDTFPVLTEDCHDKDYEWQCRGYMRLWDVPSWEVAYCMVSTPEELLGTFEQAELHSVDHIPKHMRITSIHYTRDAAMEERIVEKCAAAQAFYTDAVRRILATHGA